MGEGAGASGGTEPAASYAATEAIAKARADGTLRVIACPSASSVPDKVGECIDRLLSEGLEPGEIFVVSLRGQTAEGGVARAGRLGRHEVVRADDPRMRDHIVADSFLRVKGLERAAVIVTDLRLLEGASGEDLQRGRNARMHIALTRALVAARIVAPADELREDPVLRAWL